MAARGSPMQKKESMIEAADGGGQRDDEVLRDDANVVRERRERARKFPRSSGCAGGARNESGSTGTGAGAGIQPVVEAGSRPSG